jgi:predicted ATPase
MTQSYTAAAKQNPGRKAWLVEFRHPLRNDSSNKPGKKIRKGLGTTDEAEARHLVGQLNELLRDEALWSLGAQATAAKRFDGKVIEVFYSEIEPRVGSARALQDRLLPLPEGYARVVLLGVPGAGKTTLIRQLIGTHPKTERFPSTSVNRTTTFPTEVALRDGDFEAVVTFMSEHEARFEVEESLASAVMEAVDGDPQKAARALLEKSDMRFRLKYLLGDVQTAEDQADLYDNEPLADDAPADAMTSVTAEDAAKLQQSLAGYIDRIVATAKAHRDSVESAQGALEKMSSDDRSAALDLIEEQAGGSDEFISLVSDILDEIRTKFDLVSAGRFEKTTTGWPKAWHLKCAPEEREGFLAALRCFGGISSKSWGRLLTPLVNGMRVIGPFSPSWASATEPARLVLLDTEGLGHKANPTGDLPDHALSLLHEADIVLIVDSAKSGMANPFAGKALEAAVNAGHTRKLAVVFTHMDAARGENLKGRAKFEHVFGGVRNIVENQLAKNVSADAARYLLQHLEGATFYVGRIDELDPTPAKPELKKLLAHLMAAQPPVFEPVAFPKYRWDNLVLAIQEAASLFRYQWQGILGVATHPEHKPKPWQSIKAMTRRYAEGWNDGYPLQPTSNLHAALASAISRFLETPIEWTGTPSAEEKRDAIDRIKTAVDKQLSVLSSRRLLLGPQAAWQQAYNLSGKGSTTDRKASVEGIYQRWVPVPDARGDRSVFEFLDEVKAVVATAVKEVEDAVNQAAG